MRTPCVAGNWKMHKTIEESLLLVGELKTGLEAVENVENVICPPFTALGAVSGELEDTEIRVGAQNVFWEEEGAYTAEISPLMIAELAEYVIIGHSERRAYFGETDETVNRRVKAALKYGLIPIVCVGETLEQNEAGETSRVVSRQITGALAGVELESGEEILVAYEPVWAIGTGKAATPEGANEVIDRDIRGTLADLYAVGTAQSVRVLYGGSVKPHNAADFFSQPDIDGALVGGASLKAEAFIEITRAAG